MNLSEGDIERVNELARAAVNKSGNHFFHSLLTRTNKILGSTETNVEEEFEQAEALCTSDNLILLARYYAGEISRPRRRGRLEEGMHFIVGHADVEGWRLGLCHGTCDR